MDSVLNNLNEVWLADYNRDYKDNLTVEKDFVTWGLEGFVKSECGKKIYDYLKVPGFFSSKHMEPLPYAVEVTQQLVKKYEVYIVTAYIPENCMDKAEFTDTYYPHIGSDRIIFCNHKHLINAHYLVDDGPHNHDTFRGTSIVFNYPYSRNCHLDKIHANNWKEIGEILL